MSFEELHDTRPVEPQRGVDGRAADDGPPSAPPAAPPSAPRRRTGSLVAALLAGSIITGGAAGVGGAAAYDYFGPDPTPSTSTGETVATRSDSTSSSDESVAEAPAPAPASGSVAEVAADVLPSVVKITVTGPQGSGSGSGIILTEDGRILTNAHVVDVAQGQGQAPGRGEVQGSGVQVAFSDGTRADADIVGIDHITDTAVIQAQDVSGLRAATLGSSDALQVGQPVVAIGSPFGLDATVTSGIVSALNRPVNVGSDGQGNVTAYPAVQTDAAINPGNSGGPLVDLGGRVVGMNSSIRSTSGGAGQAGSIGLGFAIPIDEIVPIVDQIVAGEKVTHARLGVTVANSVSSSGISDGATLQSVTESSAAGKAGLRAGDIIIMIDDRPISDSDGLITNIRAYRPGDTVTVTYLRDGEQATADVTLESDG